MSEHEGYCGIYIKNNIESNKRQTQDKIAPPKATIPQSGRPFASEKQCAQETNRRRKAHEAEETRQREEESERTRQALATRREQYAREVQRMRSRSRSRGPPAGDSTSDRSSSVGVRAPSNASPAESSRRREPLLTPTPTDTATEVPVTELMDEELRRLTQPMSPFVPLSRPRREPRWPPGSDARGGRVPASSTFGPEFAREIEEFSAALHRELQRSDDLERDTRQQFRAQLAASASDPQQQHTYQPARVEPDSADSCSPRPADSLDAFCPSSPYTRVPALADAESLAAAFQSSSSAHDASFNAHAGSFLQVTGPLTSQKSSAADTNADADANDCSPPNCVPQRPSRLPVPINRPPACAAAAAAAASPASLQSNQPAHMQLQLRSNQKRKPMEAQHVSLLERRGESSAAGSNQRESDSARFLKTSPHSAEASNRSPLAPSSTTLRPSSERRRLSTSSAVSTAPYGVPAAHETPTQQPPTAAAIGPIAQQQQRQLQQHTSRSAAASSRSTTRKPPLPPSCATTLAKTLAQQRTPSGGGGGMAMGLGATTGGQQERTRVRPRNRSLDRVQTQAQSRTHALASPLARTQATPTPAMPMSMSMRRTSGVGSLTRSRSQNALDAPSAAPMFDEERERERERLALSRRTPTDDEINELWGEVREYLRHNNPAGAQPQHQQPAAPGEWLGTATGERARAAIAGRAPSEVSAAHTVNSAITSASAVQVSSHRADATRTRAKPKARTCAPKKAVAQLPEQADTQTALGSDSKRTARQQQQQQAVGYVAEFLRAKLPRGRPAYLQAPRPQKFTSELLAQFVQQAVAQVYSARETPFTLYSGAPMPLPEAALLTHPVQHETRAGAGAVAGAASAPVPVAADDGAMSDATLAAALQSGAQPLVTEVSASLAEFLRAEQMATQQSPTAAPAPDSSLLGRSNEGSRSHRYLNQSAQSARNVTTEERRVLQSIEKLNRFLLNYEGVIPVLR